MALNDTLDQMDLIDIFRAFHPKAAEWTFFSSADGIFSRIGHMVGHKTSFHKFNSGDCSQNNYSIYHMCLRDTFNTIICRNEK